MNTTSTAAQATTDTPKAEPTKTAPKPAAKKTTPAKKAPAKKAVAKKATPAKKAVPAKKAAPAGKPVKASTDANHQQWQALKRELTSVMADLLYDSRRVTPDHSKSQEEATAKVSSALKVLSEFTESIRLK